MPGRDYVASIRDFWRVCCGLQREARARVEKFLRSVLNTEEYPLTVMDRPIESETDEDRRELLPGDHPRLPERVEPLRRAQRRRPHQGHRRDQDAPDARQHDLPGARHRRLLPAQGRRARLLGLQAHPRLRGRRPVFRITTAAIDINDTRALHVATLTRDALRNMGRYIAGAEVLLCGASYRQDVGDTRYSGSEIIVRKLTEMGAEMRVHDPYVDHWYEFEKQDTVPRARALAGAVLPQPGGADGPARQKDLPAALRGRRGADPGRAARAVPRALDRTTSSPGRASPSPWSTASASSTTTRSGAISSSAARSRAWAAATSSGSRKRCARRGSRARAGLSRCAAAPPPSPGRAGRPRRAAPGPAGRRPPCTRSRSS